MTNQQQELLYSVVNLLKFPICCYRLNPFPNSYTEVLTRSTSEYYPIQTSGSLQEQLSLNVIVVGFNLNMAGVHIKYDMQGKCHVKMKAEIKVMFL